MTKEQLNNVFAYGTSYIGATITLLDNVMIKNLRLSHNQYPLRPKLERAYHLSLFLSENFEQGSNKRRGVKDGLTTYQGSRPSDFIRKGLL